MEMTGLYRAHNVYYKNLSKFRVVCTVCIQLLVSVGGILAALTINILLYFYIYNFNLIFNLIQRSELNCQFASNVQIELN